MDLTSCVPKVTTGSCCSIGSDSCHLSRLLRGRHLSRSAYLPTAVEPADMNLWDVIGSVGTVIAVLIAAWQVRRNTQQARTQFEDSLAHEYRELARDIPVQARLGSALTDAQFREVFPRLVQYLDLSNEQVFLRMTGRISRSTWEQWRDGIEAHLQQPAFAAAWLAVKDAAGSRYGELRRLEETGFRGDPRNWLPLRTKFLQSLWN
jgi:hypothetical protein